jgi:polysaccharide export outer membrane protein
MRSTYVLGTDDQVIIRAMHAEEISDKPFRIEANGYVSMPLVGRMRAASLTIEQFEADLTERLRKFYVDPQISVSISEFLSQPVSVVGAVVSPGVHQLQGRKTMLELISMVGGLRGDAGPIIKVTRQREWGRIPLPNAHEDPSGQFNVAEVNVKDLIEAKNPAENILICPKDVITVPASAIVYVIGEVKKAGGFVLGPRPTMSVLEAVSMAEGFQPRAAPQKSRILRRLKVTDTSRTEIPVNVRGILAGKTADVQLRPDDILFIPNSMAKNAALRGAETAIQIGTGLVIWGRR